MLKKEQLALTNEIVDLAYMLLTKKLANGGISAKNENAFQLELGHILKTVGQLYEFRLEDKFHLEFETYINFKDDKSERSRVDLLLEYKDNNLATKAVIELKFFKKENHREPNNRYDVFKDLLSLEKCKRHQIDLCYMIIATDHTHYVNQVSYSPDTEDFDFRDGVHYKAGTSLSYRTSKKYGADIVLRQDYEFAWDQVNDFYFLKVKV